MPRNGRSVGGNSFVDESLFGESQASKMRKKRLASAGNKILRGDAKQDAVRITRQQLAAIKQRAFGSNEPIKPRRKQQRQGPAITQITKRKPTVQEEYERRRALQGGGGANQNAMAMMDEQLDEVKGLHTMLGVMAMQKQNDAAIVVRRGRHQEERDWEQAQHEAAMNLRTQALADEKAMRALKSRRAMANRRVQEDQIAENQYHRLEVDEERDVEKHLMQRQMAEVHRQEQLKTAAKAAKVQKRRDEFRQYNEESTALKQRRRLELQAEDDRINAHLQRVAAREQEMEDEEVRLKAIRDREIAAMRKKQEREGDKAAGEHQKSAKKERETQELRQRKAESAKNEARRQANIDNRAALDRQMQAKQRLHERQKNDEMTYAGKISREHAYKEEQFQAGIRQTKERDYQFSRELHALQNTRQQHKDQAEFDRRQEEALKRLDNDVYKHKVDQVFQKHCAEHRAQGLELPPHLQKVSGGKRPNHNTRSTALW